MKTGRLKTRRKRIEVAKAALVSLRLRGVRPSCKHCISFDYGVSGRKICCKGKELPQERDVAMEVCEEFIPKKGFLEEPVEETKWFFCSHHDNNLLNSIRTLSEIHDRRNRYDGLIERVSTKSASRPHPSVPYRRRREKRR